MPEESEVKVQHARRELRAEQEASGGPVVFGHKVGAGELTPDEERRLRILWSQSVLEAHQNSCGNCGTKMLLSVHPVVPFERGGKYEVSNGVVLCRSCLFASQVADATQQSRYPTTVWVSRDVYDRLERVLLRDDATFRHFAPLARFLVESYVRTPSAYEDLEHYQSVGSDVKLNLWLDAEYYKAFREQITERGTTVVAALTALFLIFLEAEEAR